MSWGLHHESHVEPLDLPKPKKPLYSHPSLTQFNYLAHPNTTHTAYPYLMKFVHLPDHFIWWYLNPSELGHSHPAIISQVCLFLAIDCLILTWFSLIIFSLLTLFPPPFFQVMLAVWIKITLNWAYNNVFRSQVPIDDQDITQIERLHSACNICWHRNDGQVWVYCPSLYGSNQPMSMTGCHICKVSNQGAKGC
jgi:hypothetical protein